MVNSIKILIIDDNKWYAESVCHQLLNKEYENIKICHDAVMAMEQIDKELPDIIIADALLPGYTIFSFINEIISYPDTKNIPIILLTNVADNFDLKKCSGYGIVDIFDKSKLQIDKLDLAIKKAIKND